MLHIIGCVWATLASLNEDKNWYTIAEVEDKGLLDKYVAAIYWAGVTIATVGYGDIAPTTFEELVGAIILIFVGVSLYSYIVSNLSNLFSQVDARSL